VNPVSPQLGEPHHIAYVVEDIEATVAGLADRMGAGPFFLVENVPLENVLSRGEPAALIHDSAFGSFGGGAIELMEVARAAPARVGERFSAPRPRIQHVAYVVSPAEVAGVRESLDRHGLPQYLSAELGETRNTFHDGSASLGHDIEIHDDVEGLRDFFEMVRGAGEEWDGSDPLRPAPS
jgi:hypothetical protein